MIKILTKSDAQNPRQVKKHEIPSPLKSHIMVGVPCLPKSKSFILFLFKLLSQYFPYEVKKYFPLKSELLALKLVKTRQA